MTMRAKKRQRQRDGPVQKQLLPLDERLRSVELQTLPHSLRLFFNLAGLRYLAPEPSFLARKVVLGQVDERRGLLLLESLLKQGLLPAANRPSAEGGVRPAVIKT